LNSGIKYRCFQFTGGIAGRVRFHSNYSQFSLFAPWASIEPGLQSLEHAFASIADLALTLNAWEGRCSREIAFFGVPLRQSEIAGFQYCQDLLPEASCHEGSRVRPMLLRDSTRPRRCATQQMMLHSISPFDG
jgi:hypothetical protein